MKTVPSPVSAGLRYSAFALVAICLNAVPAAACQFYTIEDKIINGQAVRIVTPTGPSKFFGKESSCLDDGLTCDPATQNCDFEKSSFFGLVSYCSCTKKVRPLNEVIQPAQTAPDGGSVPESSPSAHAQNLRAEIDDRRALLEQLPVILRKNPDLIPAQEAIIQYDISGLEYLLSQLGE